MYAKTDHYYLLDSLFHSYVRYSPIYRKLLLTEMVTKTHDQYENIKRCVNWCATLGGQWLLLRRPLHLDSPIPHQKPFHWVYSQKTYRAILSICRDLGGRVFWSWRHGVALTTAALLLLYDSSLTQGLLTSLQSLDCGTTRSSSCLGSSPGSTAEPWLMHWLEQLLKL